MSWTPSSQTTLTLKQMGVDVDSALQLFERTAIEPTDHGFKTFAVSRARQKKVVSVSLSWRPSRSTRQQLRSTGYPSTVVEDLLPAFLLMVREGQPVTNLDKSFARFVANRYVLPAPGDSLLTPSVEQHLINRGFSRTGIKILAQRYSDLPSDQKTHNKFIEYSLAFNPALTDSLIS